MHVDTTQSGVELIERLRGIDTAQLCPRLDAKLRLDSISSGNLIGSVNQASDIVARIHTTTSHAVRH